MASATGPRRKRSSRGRGGPAALSGFLYQIVASLDHIAFLHISGETESDKLSDASLTLEPEAGGDAEFGGIIVQYKSRTTGTWSAKEIAIQVLPDLIAGYASRETRPNKLVFTTDASLGKIAAFYEVLNRIRTRQSYDDLDDVVVVSNVFQRQAFTEKGTVEYIRKLIVDSGRRPPPHVDVFEGLKCFEIESSSTIQKYESQIKERLLDIVPNRDRLDGKYDELLMQLFRWAATGDRAFTANELFEAVHLQATPLGDDLIILRNLSSRIQKQCDSLDYNNNMDVRVNVNLDEQCTVAVFTGNSGLGKSWSLCRAALAYSEVEWCILLQIESPHTFKDILELIAEEFCIHGWKQDEVSRFDAVLRRVREKNPSKERWLTVFLTGHFDDGIVERIIRHRWDLHGVRVVIETPVEVVNAVLPLPPAARRHEIRRFSGRERDEYLRRRSFVPATIPRDVAELLTTPLFCGIYAELATDNTWLPKNEYELLSRYWLFRFDRIIGNSPKVRNSICRLITATINEEIAYPWSDASLSRYEIPDRWYRILLRSGIFISTVQGQTRVWHDRILNWSVAKFLLLLFEAGEVTSERLIKILSKLSQHEPVSGVRYGYVLLDFIWLYLSRSEGRDAKLDQIIDGLESTDRNFEDWFYERGVPTLGTPGLRYLVQRILQASETDERRSNVHYRIARGIRQAASNVNLPELAREIEPILASPKQNVHFAAFDVIKAYPHPRILPALWRITADQTGPTDADNVHHRVSTTEAAQAAIRAGGREWLDEELEKPDHSDRQLRFLTELATHLPLEDARLLWQKHAGRLLDRQDALRQPLAKWIGLVGDDRDVDLVMSWASETDDAGGQIEAVRAVIAKRPAAVPRVLSELPFERSIYDSLIHELGIFLVVNPGIISVDTLIDALLEDPKQWWSIYRLVYWSGHTVSQPTLERIQSTLIVFLQGIGSDKDHLGPGGHLISTVSIAMDARPGQYQHTAISKRLDCLLSEFVEKAAVSRGGLDIPPDWRVVRKLLVQLGGSGLARASERLLRTVNPWAHRLIISDAGRFGTKETASTLQTLLRTISLKEKDDHARARLYDGQIALAQLGDWQSVLQNTLKNGYLPTEVLEYEKEPITSEEIDVALDIHNVTSSRPVRHQLVTAMASGHPKYGKVVRNIFDSLGLSDPDFPIAVECIGRFEMVDDKLVERVAAALPLQKKQDSLVEFLLHAGTSRSRELLLRHIVHVVESGTYPTWYMNVIKVLADGDDVIANEARQFIGRRKFHRFFFRSQIEILENLGEYRGEEAYDLLQSVALIDDRTIIHGEVPSAIVGLSKLDRTAACEAIESQFGSRAALRNQLPRTYVRVDRSRAIPFLCDRLVHEKDTGTRTEICRSLRLCMTDPSLVEVAEALLQSPDLAKRSAGIELSGWWISDYFVSGLFSTAKTHPIRSVRLLAGDALVRLRHQSWVFGYFQEFPIGDRTDRWRLLEAILRMADPFVLARRGDPLWIGKILGSGESMYVRWVGEEIDRRQKKWKDEFERWEY